MSEPNFRLSRHIHYAEVTSLLPLCWRGESATGVPRQDDAGAAMTTHEHAKVTCPECLEWLRS